MLKVEINLCEHGDGVFCSPFIQVSEDTSNETCPIIFSDREPVKGTMDALEELKAVILANFKTVAELKKQMYGGIND